MKSRWRILFRQWGAGVCLSVFLLLAAPGPWFGTIWAAPVGEGQAHKLVRGWIGANPRPMESRLGNQVESIETFTDAEGQPVYYIVYLRPNGFVIVSAEDDVEPIIGFVSQGTFDPSPQNPLGALVSRDLLGRVKAVRSVQDKIRSGRSAAFTHRESAVRDSAQKALGKWRKILAYDDSAPVEPKGLSGVSDVRVTPLLQTKWGQRNCCSYPAKACFNFYTPPNSEGSTGNYYCGCMATAMAQYMRFWQYPTAGVGTPCFTIYVDGSPQTRCLRGGDGYGGPYNWADMVLDPDCSSTATQRQAIGALAHDAGVAAGMDYSSSGSGASPYDAGLALVDTFYYSNSIFGFNNNNNIGAGLNDIVNPNLDWGNPVMLSIYNTSTGGAHAIVADGYGYNTSTLYHHLNMGWDGAYDAWYNLPNIDSSTSFNTVYAANYNIYITGTGEIISGLVTEPGTGTPIADADVTAVRTGGGTYTAKTNSKGIYAIAKIPSNSTYTVSVSKSGYSFTSPQVTTTGRSRDMEPESGNRWGVDFEGTPDALPPNASDSNVTVDAGTTNQIEMQASDDGLPNPPGAMTYIITSLPRYGTLSDPCAGQIDNVPYSLVNYGRNVNYTALACYIGDVNFQFKVNDGGSSPDGGDSNIATLNITVGSSPEIIYETYFDSGLPADWTIIDGGNTSDTWRSDNPMSRSSPYLTGVFMIADSENAGPDGIMDEQLMTQSIDCTNLTDVKLRFKHSFYHSSEEIGDVDVRVNEGTWLNAARYEGADYEGLVELNLSSYGVEGNPDVQIRWHYYNADWEWYWGIDDVSIIAVPAGSVSAPPVGDFEPDCDVDYDDLYTLTDAWLASSGQDNWNSDCDIAEPNDGIINEFDFAVFAQNWLTSAD